MVLKGYNNIDALADSVIVHKICLGLKQMRLNRNWSQFELANRSGLHRVTIARMEAGRAATLLTIVQILRALDKLEIINVFFEQQEISPMELLRRQEKQRKKASHPRKDK